MRLAIASDIHGSAKWCEKFLKAADEERADEIILLGDILYHGPRNEEPEATTPKALQPCSMSAQVPLWPYAAIAMRKSTRWCSISLLERFSRYGPTGTCCISAMAIWQATRLIGRRRCRKEARCSRVTRISSALSSLTA